MVAPAGTDCAVFRGCRSVRSLLRWSTSGLAWSPRFVSILSRRETYDEAHHISLRGSVCRRARGCRIDPTFQGGFLSRRVEWPKLGSELRHCHVGGPAHDDPESANLALMAKKKTAVRLGLSGRAATHH